MQPLTTPLTRKNNYPILIFSILATIIVWFFPALFVTPLDFDEALYRRMAEEMKSGGAFLIPTWDGKPMFDKPPTYLWFIVFASRILDQGVAVSVLAARLPSILAAICTILLTAKALPRLQDDTEHSSFSASLTTITLLFSLTLLPSAGASLVLLDPLLMLTLTPALLVLTSVMHGEHLISPRKLQAREVTILVFSMALATTVKGLVGLAIPAAAIGIHGLFVLVTSRRIDHTIQYAWRCTKVFFLPFSLAALLGTLFYLYIYFNGGADFVRSFFIEHHFQRALQSREGHSGNILYHPIVIVLGGFLLTSLVLQRLSRVQFLSSERNSLPKHLFPFSWTIGVVALFSLSATKLPNYTWPAWPGIVLGTLLWCNVHTTSARRHPAIRQIFNAISLVIPSLVGLFFITLPLLIYAIRPHVDQRVDLVLSTLPALPLLSLIAFPMAGLTALCLTAIVLHAIRKQQDLSLPLSSLFTSLFVLLVFTGATPIINALLVEPYQNAVELFLTKREPGESLHTFGLQSPLLSHNCAGRCQLAQYTRHNTKAFQTTPASSVSVLTPIWLSAACEAHGFQTVGQASWLVLCHKNQK